MLAMTASGKSERIFHTPLYNLISKTIIHFTPSQHAIPEYTTQNKKISQTEPSLPL